MTSERLPLHTSRRPVVGLAIILAAFCCHHAPARADGFGKGTRWNSWFSIGNETPAVGDFNGDGLEDIATFIKSTQTGTPEGDVYVSLSNGSSFGASSLWDTWFSPGQEIVRIGDVNGDGRDDAVTFVQSTQTGSGAGDVYVVLSHGSGFGDIQRWHGWFSIAGEIPYLGDFNGDGKDDLITFVRSTVTDSGQGDVYVALSNGNGFDASSRWHTWFCVGNEVPAVGDFDGDGRDDIVTFLKSTQTGSPEGDVYVALANSSGTGFGASSRWNGWFSVGAEVPAVGDVNGDGRDDVITFVKSAKSDIGKSDVWVALSNGAGFESGQLWQEAFGVGNEVVMTGKFNRDAKTDVIDFYRSAYTDSRQGDVYVGVAEAYSEAGPATLADFGHGGMRSFDGSQAFGERPLLVILMNNTQSPSVSWTNCPLLPTGIVATEQACRNFYDRLVFGGSTTPRSFPNATDYFIENSFSKFTFSRATVVGRYNYPVNAATNREALFKQAITAAGADVDFDQFDANGDGNVTSRELAVLVIDNRTSNNGMAGVNDSVTPPGSSVSVRVFAAAVGEETSFLTLVHELSHTLGTEDLYGDNNLSTGLTLLGFNRWGLNNRQSIHMDPWHKMRLGWMNPAVYSLRETGQTKRLWSPQYTQAWNQGAVILYDPRRGTNEYFMLEYRDSAGATSYDQDVPNAGTALWYVQTDGSKKKIDLPGIGTSIWSLGARFMQRGGNVTWQASDWEFTPSWFDGSSAGVVLSTYPSGALAAVEWGWLGSPPPNITSGPNTMYGAVRAVVQGNFPAQPGGRTAAFYDPSSPDVPGLRRQWGAYIDSWSIDRLEITPTTNTPPGAYQLRIYEDLSDETTGTWINVNVDQWD